MSEGKGIPINFTFCARCGEQMKPHDASAASKTPGESTLASVTCYAATVIVHTPSGPVPACEEHAARIRDLMRFMGAHVNFTEASTGDECSNCINEAKRHNYEISGGTSAALNG